jgi:multidrug efflux system outer membrane protein
MLRANAEQIQASADLNQAERQIVAGQYEFVRQLGWEEPRVIIATGTLDVAYFQLAPREIIPDLLANNPTVALAEARVRSANNSVAQARSYLWPNLSASYSRSNFGPSYFPDNSTWRASGNLNIPIFNNGPLGTYFGIASAKRLREAAVLDLRATRMQVRSELENAWSELAGAMDEIQVQQAFLAAARQRNDEADIRYSNGLMSYEDWTVIVSDRVNFERSTVIARRNGLLALAQWNASAGLELGNEK